MYRKEKGENFVGKRADPSTPSTAWPHFEFSSSVSARKLCATLWELQPHCPLHNMHKGSPRLRLQHFKDKGFDYVDVHVHTPLPQPTSSSSSRNHISALQHHGLVERNGHGFHNLVSSSCYTSSVEVTSSSLGIKERNGESGYRVKPSTQLLKVLNRICALEKQQISNMSLIKALKTELDLSRDRIKDLQEQDRIKVTIKSLRDELESERKLRKHSESLHRKLARQLSEVNSCFANALKELEREIKARTLLENLCDEFARVQCVKHKHRERMQMKPAEHNTVVDKLGLDAQTFLKAERDIGPRKCKLIKEYGSHRHSLESFPLNDFVSAPQGAVDKEDSSDHSDKQCNELNKTVEMRPRNSNKGCKLHRSRGQFDDKVRNESRFREDLIRSIRASPVQQWISKLKYPDFEKESDPSTKLRNEYIVGKITRSK